jgi:hypothetical protein
MPTRIAKATSLFAALATAAVVAGCGGSGDSTQSTASQPRPQASTAPVPGGNEAASAHSGEDKAKSSAKPHSSDEKKATSNHADSVPEPKSGISVPAHSPAVRAALESLSGGKHRKEDRHDPLKSVVKELITPDTDNTQQGDGSNSGSAPKSSPGSAAEEILEALQK